MEWLLLSDAKSKQQNIYKGVVQLLCQAIKFKGEIGQLPDKMISYTDKYNWEKDDYEYD